jgi:multiple sugar transport system permease protein
MAHKAFGFQREKAFPYMAIFPAVAIVILVGLVPSVHTFILSLQSYELVSPPARFVGLANYIDLLSNNPRYIHALLFTVLFALAATALELLLGFVLAYLLADREVSHAYSSLIRTLLLVPFVVAPVAVSYTFKTLIYDQTLGYLSYFLSRIGVPPFNLFEGTVNPIAGVLVMEVILRTPFVTIVLYAGISSIDPSISLAADIDGASSMQKVARIVIPMVLPVAVVAAVLRFMDALKMFDEIYVLTAGGPGYVTENVSLFTISQAFSYFHMGYAAAAAFIFLLLVIFLVSFFMRAFKN